MTLWNSENVSYFYFMEFNGGLATKVFPRISCGQQRQILICSKSAGFPMHECMHNLLYACNKRKETNTHERRLHGYMLWVPFRFIF